MMANELTTVSEAIALMKQEAENIIHLIEKKNQDYSGDDGDFFSNFRVAKYFDITTVQRGIMTRLLDKISRTANLMSGVTSPAIDEPIQETIRDLIGYSLILLVAVLRDEQ